MSDTIVNAPTFLDNLRKATHTSHTALEALPVSASILKPDVTNEEYAHYLTLMRDVVKDAEENIFLQLSNVVTELEAKNKTHLLEADLKTLGAELRENSKPVSEGLSNVTNAFALGILYVIEGSALGGRVILKNITAALGHDATSGAAYFSGYGNKTGSQWKAFLDDLTKFESESNEGAEIIAGANYAFDAIHKHFSEGAK